MLIPPTRQATEPARAIHTAQALVEPNAEPTTNIEAHPICRQFYVHIHGWMGEQAHARAHRSLSLFVYLWPMK